MAIVPDISILFKLDGVDKRLDFKKVPFSAWSELKRELQFTPQTLTFAMRESDVESFAAIIWLERRQTETGLAWASVRSQFEKHVPDFELVDGLVDQSEPDPQTAGS